jgi:hypothetical protein
MPDIFISHVEEDSAIALQIAQGLEAVGYTTWYHERDSVPGPSYLVQTGEAIEQSKAVVLVVSAHSLESNQVTSEVVRAHEGGKPFVPILYGINHTDFQHRQPLWRQAVGSAASISVPAAGISAILPRIIVGLKSLEVQPGGQVTTPVAPPPGPAHVSPERETQRRERGTAVVFPVRPGLRESRWFPLMVVLFLVQGIVIIALVLRLMQLTSRSTATRTNAAGPTATQLPGARPTSTPRPATATPRPSPTRATEAAATATASPEMIATPTSFVPMIATAEAVATSMAMGMSTPPAGESAQPVQGFGLPLRDPDWVLYDGSALWVTFGRKWTKLDLVEAEQRFRALGEEWSFASQTVAWDLSGDWYWALTDTSADIINRSGTKTASYALPEGFTDSALAWDGRSLWALHGDDTLHRYEPVADVGQLKEVDSYAPQVERLSLTTTSGLTWDGNNLWVLAVGSVFKLNSAAQPVCSIDLGGSWTFVRSWRGLGWDGRFLWAADAHSNMLYRVDPNACQE